MLDGRYVRAYLELVRPFTSFPPFFAVVFGALAGAFATGSNFNIKTLFYAAFAMVLAQMFGQVTNQLADPIELDAFNNKNRVLVRGEVERDSVVVLSIVLLLATVALSLVVHRLYAGLVGLTILSALLYNFEPVRLKKRFLLNNLILAFSRGAVPMLAAWSVFASLTEQTYYYALGLFLWVFGWQTTKDIPDIEGDRKFGVRTIPVVFGKHGAIKFISYVTYVFLLYHFLLGFLTGEIRYIILGGVLFLLGFIGIRKMEEKTKTENNFGWATFYIGIVIYYVLVFILSIVNF